MEDRYHRQGLIPDWDQNKIANAKIIILGVGALGSYLATNLALTGIGELILVDFDTINHSNLNRQLLFHQKDIGQNKAKVAKERLQILNPEIKISIYEKEMQKMPKNLINGSSLIASCLDTFIGRRWANSLALREKIPMVTGGMYAFLGNVQTIIPFKTACFECQPLISQEKLAQACSPLGETRKELKNEKTDPPMPSISTISSIIAGLMSQEIIKVLLDIGNPVNNFLFYDGLNNNFTELELSKNKNCPICGENYKLQNALVLVIENENVADFRHRIALAFGLANPTLMLKGKILVDDEKMMCNNGDKIFAIDERLAAPIALEINFRSEI